MDLRQTKEYGEYMKSQGWIVDEGFFVKKVPFLPISILKSQRFENVNWEKYETLRKKYRVFYSVLEPNMAAIEGRRFHLSSTPYLPTKTVAIDLTKSEDRLLKEMSKDARQRTKNYESRITNHELRTTVEIQKFREEWQKQNKGYVSSLTSLQNLKKAFGNKCWILEATLGETPLGGAVILLSDDTAYYYFAWTNEKGRELGAQYGLIWNVIKRAKKMGLKKFDLEGIYDERWPLPRWKGFTGFKKKFGGEVVEYPGSYQRWL